MKTKQISDAIKVSKQKKIKSDARIHPGNMSLIEKRPPAYFKFRAIASLLAPTPKEPPGALKSLRG